MEKKVGSRVVLEEIVVRRVKKDDFIQLFKLVNNALREETQITGLDLQRLSRVAKLYNLAVLFLEVLRIFFHYYETIFVATMGNKVIGEIHIATRGKYLWTMDSIAVDANFRRRGIGSNLMRKALEYISKNQGGKVTFYARSDNFPALKLYDRFGFKVFEESISLLFEASALSNVKIDKSTYPLIREVSPKDAQRIYQICRALDFKRIQVYKIAPEEFLYSFLEYVMSKSGWVHSKKWVIELEGKVIGYAHITFTSPQEAGKIKCFYLLRPNDSPKLESWFLSRILDFFVGQNIKKVIVNLNKKRKETIEVFERSGCKRVAFLYGCIRNSETTRA